MRRSAARRFALIAAVVVGGLLTLAGPASAANPTITILNSPPPLLAGRTVVLNGSGFLASTPVLFFWDGVKSTDPPPSADQFGNLSGQAVSIPLSLSRGTHTLSACTEETPTTCATALATAPVVIGPTITTSTTMPVHRLSTVSVTVGGEPSQTPSNTPATAIYRWNGGPVAGSLPVPDMATFTITPIVPANAPAHSTFQICEDAGGGTCLPGTSGTLAVSVVVPAPPPPPPPPTHSATPTPTPTPTAVASSSPTPAPSPSPSPKPTPKPTPTPTPTPSATPAPPPPAPPAPPTPPAPTQPKPLYTPRAIVHLEVTALALISTLGVGAMFRGIGGLMLPRVAELGEAASAIGAGGAAGRRLKGSAASAKIKVLKGGREATEAGDRSITWHSPGTGALDALALAAPVRVAPFSPMLARVLIDASYLRAMVGSLAILLPIGGLALGVAAAQNTGGHVTPPSVGLLAGLAVLGVFDAFAGFLAASVFMIAAAFTGDLWTVHGLRMILGLGVVWFAAPLIAAATRPLRRLPSSTVADRRRRIADLVLASLIGAWAVEKMIDGLPGLAGHPLAITHDDKRVALVVLVAIVIRVALETGAARFYPLRLGEVQAASVPQAGNRQKVLMSFVRTGVFMFFAVAFLGWHWQLWVGAAIILVSQLLSIYEEQFHNFPHLYRWLPRGLTKLVLLLFVGAWVGTLVLDALSHDAHEAADAFVLLCLPGLVVTLIELHVRDGDEPDETWLRWLAGVGVLGLGLAFVFGYLS